MLRVLFSENFDFVWNLLRRLGVHEAEREDLANEVFFRVYQRLDEYDKARPLRPWLCAFTVRVAAEHKRLARHKREVFEEPPSVAAPHSAPEIRIDRSRQREVLSEALDTLDEPRRAVFVLHELEEMTTREIAQVLGIPEGTVSSRLRSARADIVGAVRRIRARTSGGAS